MPPNRISLIIAGKRSITGDTALRLGHWFGIDPQFWMNLQAQFDLATAEQFAGAASLSAGRAPECVVRAASPTSL